MSTATFRQIWLGPQTYSEADSARFFGRDEEIRELTRLITHEPLVVVHGESGHGKSSLIQAGVVPELRRRGFFPVVMRELFRDDTEEIVPKVFAAIRESAAEWKATTPAESSTLWEYFHREGAQFCNSLGYPVEPVLIFDQFEDIFRRLKWVPDAQNAAARFATLLADLIENREPSSVREMRGEDGSFNYHARNFRIVIVLREDALPSLTPMRDLIPSLSRCPFRLGRLTQAGALEVIIKPAHAAGSESLLGENPEQNAASILAAMHTPDLAVDPFILSVVMDQIHRQATRGNAGIIDAALIQSAVPSALNAFYEKSVALVSPTLRDWLEEEGRLVTAEGFRKNFTLGDVRRAGLVSAESELRLLEDAHLIRRENLPDGSDRFELAHDRFCSIVAERGAQRKEQRLAKEAHDERKRVQALRSAVARARILAALAILSAIIAFVLWKNARAARESADAMRGKADREATTANNERENAKASALQAKSQQESAERAAKEAIEARRKLDDYLKPASRDAHRIAQENLSGTQWKTGVAQLAKAIAFDPTNTAAASHLWTALALDGENRAVLPVHWIPVDGNYSEIRSKLDQSGNRVAVWDKNGICRVFDTGSGDLIETSEPEPPDTKSRHFAEAPICISYAAKRETKARSEGLIFRMVEGKWKRGAPFQIAEASDDGAVTIDILYIPPIRKAVIVAELADKWHRVLSLETGEVLHESRDPAPSTVSYPGGWSVASFPKNGQVNLFDMSSKSVRTFQFPDSRKLTEPVTWNIRPDIGQFAAWNTNQKTVLIFGSDGKTKQTIETANGVNALSVSPSGERGLVVENDVNVYGDRNIFQFTVGRAEKTRLAEKFLADRFLEDDLRVATSGINSTGTVGSRFIRSADDYPFGESNSEVTITVSRQAGGVAIYDLRVLPFDSDIYPGFSSKSSDLNWMPDNTTLQAFDREGDGFLHTIQTDAATEGKPLNLTNDAVARLQFAEAGKTVFTGRRGHVFAADTEAGEVFPPFVNCKNINGLPAFTLSLDRKRYFFECEGKKIHVIEKTTGKEITRWVMTDAMKAIHPDGLLNLALSEDKKHARIQRSEGGSFIRDEVELKEQKDEVLARTSEHAMPISDAGFSKDGTQFYTLASDNTFRLWLTKDGSALGELALQIAESENRGIHYITATSDSSFSIRTSASSIEVGYINGKLDALRGQKEEVKNWAISSSQITLGDNKQPSTASFAFREKENGSPNSEALSPNIRKLAITNESFLLRVYSMPDLEALQAPEWAVEFASAVAGQKPMPDGTYAAISESERLATVRRLHREHPGNGPWKELLTYWATPPSKRTRAPMARQTYEEQLDRFLKLPPEREESMCRAHRAALLEMNLARPENGLIILALAALETQTEDAVRRADYLRRYGFERVPNTAKAWRQAESILKWEGHKLAADAATRAEALENAK